VSSLYPLPNRISSLPARTFQTLAHRFHPKVAVATQRHVGAKPTKFFISDPSSLASSRSNPDFCLSIGVHYRQNPLSFKVNDVSISNLYRFKRIDNDNRIALKKKLRSNPHQVYNGTQNNADQDFKDFLNSISKHKKRVYREESYQNQRAACPSKVTSGSKSLIHFPIIAGEIK